MGRHFEQTGGGATCTRVLFLNLLAGPGLGGSGLFYFSCFFSAPGRSGPGPLFSCFSVIWASLSHRYFFFKVFLRPLIFQQERRKSAPHPFFVNYGEKSGKTSHNLKNIEKIIHNLKRSKNTIVSLLLFFKNMGLNHPTLNMPSLK